MTSRTRGGEGGCPKHDVVREVAWIYSYDQPKMCDKGGAGGGSKNPKICVTSFMDGPLSHASIIAAWKLTTHGVITHVSA